MDNKICLVTGATSGVGKVIALELAKRKAYVILVARNREKGESVKADIVKASGNKNVDILMCDLSSQKSIRDAAAEFRSKYDRLHRHINNAAVVPAKKTITVDGMEIQLAVNHLSYFLLTHELLNLLKDGAPSRVCNTGSEVHKRASIDVNDLQSAKRYKPMRAYAMTKLLNMHFTHELARKLEGSGIAVYAWSPGWTATGISRDYGAITRFIMNKMAKTPEEGAATGIYVATSPDLEGKTGTYYYNLQETRAAESSYDIETSKRIWKISEDLTGIKT